MGLRPTNGDEKRLPCGAGALARAGPPGPALAVRDWPRGLFVNGAVAAAC